MKTISHIYLSYCPQGHCLSCVLWFNPPRKDKITWSTDWRGHIHPVIPPQGEEHETFTLLFMWVAMTAVFAGCDP